MEQAKFKLLAVLALAGAAFLFYLYGRWMARRSLIRTARREFYKVLNLGNKANHVDKWERFQEAHSSWQEKYLGRKLYCIRWMGARLLDLEQERMWEFLNAGSDGKPKKKYNQDGKFTRNTLWVELGIGNN